MAGDCTAAQYRILAASGLDWTMVMPPMLTNGKAATGKIRVDGDALPPGAESYRAGRCGGLHVRSVGLAGMVSRGVYISI